VSDIKLFSLSGKTATALHAIASDLEKPLQTLIEKNLVALLGVRFLDTEYSTGKTHGGRIDTLGLDENNCPVILEYKRSTGENVINQGLYYMDWLMDHQAEFKLLVMDKLGKVAAGAIDWSAPRLICIAAEFTRYDAHAVQQINRNIELIRYRKFSPDLLLLELINAVSEKPSAGKPGGKAGKASSDKPLGQALADMTPAQRDLFASLEGYLMSLGDDVQRKDLKLYIAYKRMRNFVCVIVQKGKFTLEVSLNPDEVDLVEGFTRGMRHIGHWGTGDLEITLRSPADLERAKPLLQRAYEGI
jgi:predicted transport protein